MIDAAKFILARNTVEACKKKLRVAHYESLLRDFGVPSKEFSEERGGKTLRLKAKDLAAFFWSRADVVDRYHVYEDGDSSSSFEDADDSVDDDTDSYEWIPDSVTSVGQRGKRRRPTEDPDDV